MTYPSEGFDDARYDLFTFTGRIPVLFVVLTSAACEARLGGGMLTIPVSKRVSCRNIDEVLGSIATVGNNIHNGLCTVCSFDRVRVVYIKVFYTCGSRAKLGYGHLNFGRSCHIFDYVNNLCRKALV